MKKYFIVLLVCAFLASLTCAEKSYARNYKNVRDLFDHKGKVKAHVSNISNKSDDSSVNVEELKGLIEKKLAARRSHNVEVVSSLADADLVIDIVVTKYFWTDHDPIDMIFSPGSVIIDIIKKENYALMQIDVIITDTKTQRKLWDDHVVSTITDGTMSEEASYAMSYERIAKNLIKELFKRN